MTSNNHYTNVRLNDATHARLSEHCRDGETLSGCVDRALDALEREGRLPDAVAQVIREERVNE